MPLQAPLRMARLYPLKAGTLRVEELYIISLMLGLTRCTLVVMEVVSTLQLLVDPRLSRYGLLTLPFRYYTWTLNGPLVLPVW